MQIEASQEIVVVVVVEWNKVVLHFNKQLLLLLL